MTAVTCSIVFIGNLKQKFLVVLMFALFTLNKYMSAAATISVKGSSISEVFDKLGNVCKFAHSFSFHW